MAVNIPPALVELVNKVEPGRIVYAHFVPTRIIRVTVDVNFCTFRVEQLIRTNRDNMKPMGSWRTLSTHGSETPGQMLQTAMSAARDAQQELIRKLQSRQVKRGIIRA